MQNRDSLKIRNYSLDFLKGVAAIFVVFIHAVFPGVFGKYVAEIGCFAVPIFFMTSGYFNASASREKTRKSIQHILILIAFTYFLNVIRIFVLNEFSISRTFIYLKNIVVNVKNIGMWLLLNVTRISGVAWFLFALLYCYIFRYLFDKIYKKQIVYLAMIFGFVGGIAIKMLFPLLGIGFNGVNNVWVKGIPFFLCGKLIYEKRECIAKTKNVPLILATAIIGYVLLSYGFAFGNGVGYIGMMFLSVSLFTLCLVYPGTSWATGKSVKNLICQMGGKYSFFIYIGHPLVMHIFDAIVKTSGIILWVRPIIILMCTLILASIYYMVKKQIKSMVQ